MALKCNGTVSWPIFIMLPEKKVIFFLYYNRQKYIIVMYGILPEHFSLRDFLLSNGWFLSCLHVER